jgi:O-antigen/teichoic acid export membrane protein
MVTAGDSNVPNDSGGEASRRGLRHEVAKPYRFFYALLVSVTAVSAMVYLLLLVLIYGPTDTLKITLGISIVCLCISIIPLIPFAVRWRRGNGHINIRTLLYVYSWREVGWIDRVITLALFATVFIAFSFFVGHGHPHAH